MRSLKNFTRIIKFIAFHPLNSNHQFKAIFSFFKWQLAMRLIKRRVIIPWVDDASFVVGLGETGLTGNIYAGLMEYEDMAFLLHALRPDEIFVDVGANVGDYSKEVIASYPGTQAFLFEPHPQTFQKLENESALKAARKFNIAFGEKLEKINFYDRSDISGGSSHASFYKEVISGIHNQNPVGFEVEVKTLDSFCSDYNILKIDFLKIDTEGHELAVLKGAKNLIAQQKIQLIQFEFNEMNVVSRTYMRDFVELLSNYQLHRVVPDGYFPLNNCVQDIEIFGFQNILAIPKN
jgi:FkbM family methyltransferase